MHYTISRNGQEYGPYTLGDLQRYVATGEILLTDMARSEGMTESLPVSQIIGTIPMPVTTPMMAVPRGSEDPEPPNLHWALVLLFGILSCGLFLAAWDIVLAAWMKTVAPKSTAIYYFVADAALLVVIFFLSFVHGPGGAVSLVQLIAAVVAWIGRFSLRSSLEDYYNAGSSYGLTLSGVMTFFFGSIYFQYHLNHIAQVKRAERLSIL